MTTNQKTNRKCTYCRGKYERIQRCLICFGTYGSWVWTPKRQKNMNKPETLTAERGVESSASTCSEKLLPTTCEECDRLGWPTKQPLHGIEGQTLCWTHAMGYLRKAQNVK